MFRIPRKIKIVSLDSLHPTQYKGKLHNYENSYCYMRYSTHCSRDKHLARPVINKKK